MNRLAALILLGTASLIQTTEAPHQISLTVAEPGDNLTLTCPVIGTEVGLLYWYKMNFGYVLQIVASGTFHKVKRGGQFDNPRFDVTKVGDLQYLIIRNVSKEDEATYMCQAGTAYVMKFINGTILAVNDHKNQQKHVYVKQSPETASVQLGASMTLQCSLLSTNKGNRVQCPGEHSVHWFRAGSGGFHPGILYTHSSRRDEQEERSCVYSLSKTIHNSSDAGTYYCAVVTCGQILFGEGTTVETADVYLDFSSWSPAVTAEVPQLISLTVVEVGGNVTLPCPLSETQHKVFHWYKQALGYMFQTVVTRAYEKPKFSEQFMSSRFDITENKSQSLLTIRNVSKEDEATYFCLSGTAYSPRFVTGIFLAVNDYNQQKDIYVQQSPETASVQLGASVTLQCSLLSTNKGNRVQCPGEHSVHWFRAGSGGFHPGIVYTNSSRRDEQEERSYVYSLSKTIHNSSDAGTYYCAVVTCGQILFGEGSKVETIPELDPVDIVLGGLLACCVTVIAVLIYYLNRRKACEHCKGSSHNPGHDKLTVDQSTDPDGDADAANYVALNFSTRREKRVKKREESPQECVYSAVKVNYHTSR